MFYLDASLIVTFLTPEPAHGQVRAWLSDCSPDTLHISPWVMTEVSSALSIKLRVGDLTPEMRSSAKAAFGRFFEASLTLLSVEDQHFADASAFADQAATGLRAGDALHLAISKAHGLTLVTRDKKLVQGGQLLGGSTLLL